MYTLIIRFVGIYCSKYIYIYIYMYVVLQKWPLVPFHSSLCSRQLYSFDYFAVWFASSQVPGMKNHFDVWCDFTAIAAVGRQ